MRPQGHFYSYTCLIRPFNTDIKIGRYPRSLPFTRPFVYVAYILETIENMFYNTGTGLPQRDIVWMNFQLTNKSTRCLNLPGPDIPAPLPRLPNYASLGALPDTSPSN